jgi:hypothetical protein
MTGQKAVKAMNIAASAKIDSKIKHILNEFLIFVVSKSEFADWKSRRLF